MTVLGVLFATVFAAIALIGGQDVRRVGLNGDIEFFSRAESGAITPEEEQRQQAIEQRVASLEDSARGRQPTSAPPSTADLSGTWVGPDGLAYVVEQFGTEAIMTERGAVGLTGYAEGVVTGGRFDFTFAAVDGSVGVGSLTLAGNGRLTGSFSNTTHGDVVDVELRR